METSVAQFTATLGTIEALQMVVTVQGGYTTLKTNKNTKNSIGNSIFG